MELKLQGTRMRLVFSIPFTDLCFLSILRYNPNVALTVMPTNAFTDFVLSQVNAFTPGDMWSLGVTMLYVLGKIGFPERMVAPWHIAEVRQDGAGVQRDDVLGGFGGGNWGIVGS